MQTPEEIARPLAIEAHCRYCNPDERYREKCKFDLDLNTLMIAAAIAKERADRDAPPEDKRRLDQLESRNFSAGIVYEDGVGWRYQLSLGGKNFNARTLRQCLDAARKEIT